MKILITGATGFIGSYLLRRLADTPHQLLCLVRPSSNTRQLEDLEIPMLVGDVFDRDLLLEGMQGCDCVIHLANVYSFWEPDPRVYTRVNVEGTRSVLEAALQAGVKKVIYVSTAVIWGSPNGGTPYNEETPFAPQALSSYARSKRAGDRIAWDLAEKQGLPLVGIYPAAVLGAGDLKASGQMTVDIMKHRLPATGMQRSVITFVHVQDVAEAIVRAAEKPDTIGRRYIIGRESISLDTYMQTVSQLSGVRLPLIPLPDWAVWAISGCVTAWGNLTKTQPLWGMSLDQTRTFITGFRCDGSKAERDLGLTYTPLSKAFEEQVAWVRQKFPDKGWPKLRV